MAVLSDGNPLLAYMYQNRGPQKGAELSFLFLVSVGIPLKTKADKGNQKRHAAMDVALPNRRAWRWDALEVIQAETPSSGEVPLPRDTRPLGLRKLSSPCQKTQVPLWVPSV